MKWSKAVIFSSFHQQVIPKHFLGSRAPVCATIALEDKCLYNKVPPPLSSFLLAFIAEHNIICYGISLWSLWVSCPGYISSQHLADPQPAGLWGEVGETTSMAREHCSAVPKHWHVINTVLATKLSTMRAAMVKVNSISVIPYKETLENW